MPTRTTDMTSEWLVTQLLSDLGEDVRRPGLEETPERFVKAMQELLLTSRYSNRPTYMPVEALFKTFDEPCDEIVVSKDIEFVSLCEHHVLPFTGHVHVGYLPSDNPPRVIGLSKIARVVDHFSRKLQTQERLGQEVANAFMEHLKPRGVGVVIEARHMCQSLRGVKKQDAVMMTSALRGVFKTDPTTRKEFFDLINKGK